MSTQADPVRIPEPNKVEQASVPDLTDSYRKAHKGYVLAAGLLASWELLGVTLQTKEKWGIELKSPNAVPLILFTVMFYSGYKMTIEWLQCDPERRRNKLAKLDYLIAHVIAAMATVIGIVQYLWRIQIVDILVRGGLQGPGSHLTLGLFLVACCVIWFDIIKRWRHVKRHPRIVKALFSLSFLLFLLGLIAFTWLVDRWTVIYSYIGGIIMATFILWTQKVQTQEKS